MHGFCWPVLPLRPSKSPAPPPCPASNCHSPSSREDFSSWTLCFVTDTQRLWIIRLCAVTFLFPPTTQPFSNTFKYLLTHHDFPSFQRTCSSTPLRSFISNSSSPPGSHFSLAPSCLPSGVMVCMVILSTDCTLESPKELLETLPTPRPHLEPTKSGSLEALWVIPCARSWN